MPPDTMLIVGALVALLVAAVIFERRRGDRRAASGAPPVGDIVAIIDEDVAFSVGGIIAVVMLVLFNVAAVFAWYGASNVFQQGTAALVWVGWNVLWGTGAVIGRKRRYVVRRIPAGSEK